MQTVIGLFENAYEAQQAAQQLMSAGFSSNDIDVSVRGGSTGSGNYASDETSAGTTSSGYATGSTYNTGAYDDKSVRLSDDDTSSSSYSPKDDDDSFGDKVSRFFRNLFGSDDDQADRYTHIAKETGCLVTVYAQSKEEAERAADILDDNGAMDVDKRAADYGYAGTTSDAGTTYSSKNLDRTSDDYISDDESRTSRNLDRTSDDIRDDESKTLNVIREDIQVGKREVETGGVRLRSRIVERPIEESIRLREERVIVERNPVDRPATTSDFQNFKEGEIEMTERAEIADVKKEARVVEEVRLSKEVEERNETINETARDTEVDVEDLSNKEAISRKNRNL